MCFAVPSIQLYGSPTAQMFEDVYDKDLSDAPVVAIRLQEAYETQTYDWVEAWLTYFTIFPEAASAAPTIDRILIDWAASRPGIPNQVIERAILIKTLARSPIPTAAKVPSQGLRPDLTSWGDWRRQNPTKGYLSEKFRSDQTLPEAEVKIFDILVLSGETTLEPTEVWMKKHISQFDAAASGLKGSNFVTSLEGTLYHGGILTNVLSNPGYKSNLWSESMWATEIPKFARSIFGAKDSIASVAMLPLQAKALAGIEEVFSNLQTGSGIDILARFRTINYSKSAPLFFAYVWPIEDQQSLLALLDNYALPNLVRPQTTNALNFLKSSSDYLQNNSQNPNRYLSALLLSHSDINAETFAVRPEGTYDLPEPGNMKPAWLSSLQGLSKAFALSYHSGFNCQDFKAVGFDVAYNINSRFAEKFKRSIPDDYLPAEGDVSRSGAFHRRFVRCDPLVNFYKYSMSILLNDMKRAKEKLDASNSACARSWAGHDSKATQSCPLYISAGMVSSESQATAIYNDDDLKQKWFAFLSNKPEGSLRDTQLQIWSRDPEGIQGQFTCRLWLKHTKNLTYTQTVLDDSFVKSSFEDTIGFLFTLAMAHKDLNAEGVISEEFARYTSDVNQASDACSVEFGNQFVPMPTNLYSRAYELATGLAHIAPLQETR